MGCIFYYVLSRGGHPFGEFLKRQSNIVEGVFDMTEMKNKKKSKNILALELISDMIRVDPTKRPKVEAILKHPMFWDEKTISSFFQEVSDRLEGAVICIPQNLENNPKLIYDDEWSSYFPTGIVKNLVSHRKNINFKSVRELLRAFRNLVRK